MYAADRAPIFAELVGIEMYALPGGLEEVRLALVCDAKVPVRAGHVLLLLAIKALVVGVFFHGLSEASTDDNSHVIPGRVSQHLDGVPHP